MESGLGNNSADDEHHQAILQEYHLFGPVLYPSRRDMKEIFDNYGGLTKFERLKKISELKKKEYSKLIFSLRHPFEINLEY